MICEELYGPEYLAIPFEAEEDAVGSRMEIGYISRKNMLLSDLAERYIHELDRYLKQYQQTH